MSTQVLHATSDAFLARQCIPNAITALRARDARAEDKLWLIHRHISGVESDATMFAVTVSREDAAVAAKALLDGTLKHICISQIGPAKWRVIGAWASSGERADA